MTETLGERIRSNTRASIIAWAWNTLSRLVLVAVIFDRIGVAGYGLWQIAFPILSYFTLYNFGINSAFVKYTAEYYAKEDYPHLGRLLSTGMAVGITLGLATFLLLFAFHVPLIQYFNMDDESMTDARFVLLSLGLLTAFSIAFGVYKSVLTGIQRIDTLNYVRITLSVMDILLSLAGLLLGFGVRALVAGYAVSIIGTAVASAWYVKRYLPDVSINPFRSTHACLREIFSLGMRMQALGVLTMLVVTVDGLVMARFKGLAFMGAYALGRRLARQAQSMLSQGFGPLAPASADLHARDDARKLRAVFGTALRITAVTTACVCAFLAVNSDFVILAVVNQRESNDLSSIALRFLMIATVVHTLTGPGTSMLRGAGKPFLESVYQCITVVLFLVFVKGAAMLDNEKMIVLSFPAGLTVASCWFMVTANRYFKLPLLAPFDSTFMPLIVAPLLALLIRAGWSYLPLPATDSRWPCVLALAGMGAIYTVAYGALAWRLPGLTVHDKDQLLRFIPYGYRIMSLISRSDLGIR